MRWEHQHVPATLYSLYQSLIRLSFYTTMMCSLCSLVSLSLAHRIGLSVAQLFYPPHYRFEAHIYLHHHLGIYTGQAESERIHICSLPLRAMSPYNRSALPFYTKAAAAASTPCPCYVTRLIPNWFGGGGHNM